MHTLSNSGLQLPQTGALEGALFGTPDEPLTDDEEKM
jgi:hypothetical protein